MNRIQFLFQCSQHRTTTQLPFLLYIVRSSYYTLNKGAIVTSSEAQSHLQQQNKRFFFSWPSLKKNSSDSNDKKHGLIKEYFFPSTIDDEKYFPLQNENENESKSMNNSQDSETIVKQDEIKCKINPKKKKRSLFKKEHIIQDTFLSFNEICKLSENDSSNLIILHYNHKYIYLIGTSHHSILSAIRVTSLMSAVNCDTLFLEICEKRLKQMRIFIACQSPWFSRIAHFIHKLYVRYPKSTLMKNINGPYMHGGFTDAIKFAAKERIKIVCGDEDCDAILDKLQSVIMNSNEFTSIKYSADDEEETDDGKNGMNKYLRKKMLMIDEIQELKFYVGNHKHAQDSNYYIPKRMSNIIPYGNKKYGHEKSRDDAREIIANFPKEVYYILHVERDVYLAEKLMKFCESDENCDAQVIVAVVGMGHMDGIHEWWGENVVNMSASEVEIPEILK